jgi:hypothetical protein
MISTSGDFWNLTPVAISNAFSVCANHPKANSRDSTISDTLNKKSHIQALYERLLDFINVMAFKNVMLPGLLLQANNYFVNLSCEIVFPRMLFKEERRNELNAVLSQTHVDGQKLYTWVEKNKLISPTTPKW